MKLMIAESSGKAKKIRKKSLVMIEKSSPVLACQRFTEKKMLEFALPDFKATYVASLSAKEFWGFGQKLKIVKQDVQYSDAVFPSN